jgi:hypothetical protein
MKWVVFDFEFTELLPPHDAPEPWASSVQIACAALYCTNEAWPQVWYERAENGAHQAAPEHHMSESTLSAFVSALQEKLREGYSIGTWGGAGSDWRMLCKECPSREADIRALAMASVDVPMASCMSIGMMMGLNAACRALGVALKDTEASASVPDLWTAGGPQGRFKALQHVSNDAYATLLVIKQAESSGSLPWVTQRGIIKTWSPVKFLTVAECLRMELPPVPFTIGPNMNPKILARWLFLNS